MSWLRRFRHSAAPQPDPARPRVEPRDLGLEEHLELGTFVQFSAAGSRSCRESLNRLAAAVARTGGRATVIELPVNAGSILQRRLGVRHVPSVYLVDASGWVTHYWPRPPQADELAVALGLDSAPALTSPPA